MNVIEAVDKLQTAIEDVWADLFPNGKVPDTILSRFSDLRNVIFKCRDEDLIRELNEQLDKQKYLKKREV